MIKKLAAAAILATLAASSFAATPGYYAGVDVGATKLSGDDLGRSPSFGGFVGYTFSPNFALEAGLRRLGSWDEGVNSADLDQASVSLIGSVPVNAKTSIYGRLGYNRLRASTEVSGETISGLVNKALYGVGVSYDFGGNISGRVEVQKPHPDVTNISVGMLVSF